MLIINHTFYCHVLWRQNITYLRRGIATQTNNDDEYMSGWKTQKNCTDFLSYFILIFFGLVFFSFACSFKD